MSLAVIAAKNGNPQQLINALRNPFEHRHIHTAFLVALQTGIGECIDILLGLQREVIDISAYGMTPLYYAVGCSHLKAIHYLLENGFDINNVGDGSTAIHAAIKRHAKQPVFQLLMEYRPNLDLIDEDGFNAADLALNWNQLQVFGFLVKRGARYTETVAEKALAIGIQRRNQRTIRILLDYVTNHESFIRHIPFPTEILQAYNKLSQPNKDCYLYHAIQSGSSRDLINELLSNGGQLSPMMLLTAVEHCSAKDIDFLIRRGAEVTNEALTIAVQKDRVDVVSLLVKNGAVSSPELVSQSSGKINKYLRRSIH